MQDEYFSKPRPVTTRSNGLRAVVLVALAAFVLGCGLIGWLGWTGRLGLDFAKTAQTGTAEPASTGSALTVAIAPTSAPIIQAAAAIPSGAVDSGLDQRLAGLEQRMTRLDLQANSAAANAGRAEGLLIAFATRRALERGAPLGYLEDQLRLRFAATQPAAVDHVLAAARQPVTLDGLVSALTGLEPRLVRAAPQENGWQRFQRGLGDLFVIHRETGSALNAAERLDRAKLLLRTGQIEPAIAEISRLPGSAAAGPWIEQARRYDRAMRGLDLIEAAALSDQRLPVFSTAPSAGAALPMPATTAADPQTFPVPRP
jgi:hypothetical protein